MNARLQIRYIGLSNETPYGLMKFIQVAEKYASHLKIVSLQVWLLTTVQLLYYCFALFSSTWKCRPQYYNSMDENLFLTLISFCLVTEFI